MKLTINASDQLLRMILREGVGLTPEGVRKVMADPRFKRALEREAQTYYNESFGDSPASDWLGDIVDNSLRLTKKYHAD